MSIEEVCKKHNLSFKELVYLSATNLPRKKPKKYKKTSNQPDEEYISYTYEKYQIRKTIDGNLRHFGTYDTLEDAIKMRDYLMEHGWYTTRVKAIRRRLGV